MPSQRQAILVEADGRSVPFARPAEALMPTAGRRSPRLGCGAGAAVAPAPGPAPRRDRRRSSVGTARFGSTRSESPRSLASAVASLTVWSTITGIAHFPRTKAIRIDAAAKTGRRWRRARRPASRTSRAPHCASARHGLQKMHSGWCRGA